MNIIRTNTKVNMAGKSGKDYSKLFKTERFPSYWANRRKSGRNEPWSPVSGRGELQDYLSHSR
jgi:hypothetical protein